MGNAIAPGFIVFEYHSSFGIHEQTVPVNTINIDVGTPADTTITAWNATFENWRVMATALVLRLVDRYPATVVYDRATLWSEPTEPDLPVFVDSYAIDEPGTVVTPGYTKAVQETITARDTLGYVAKLVLLDMASTNNFDIQLTPAAAGVEDLMDEWTSVSNGWSSRAGARPATFMQATRTLNEKLRKQYHQT